MGWGVLLAGIGAGATFLVGRYTAHSKANNYVLAGVAFVGVFAGIMLARAMTSTKEAAE